MYMLWKPILSVQRPMSPQSVIRIGPNELIRTIVFVERLNCFWMYLFRGWSQIFSSVLGKFKLFLE
jgi:hypothetical protein